MPIAFIAAHPLARIAAESLHTGGGGYVIHEARIQLIHSPADLYLSEAAAAAGDEVDDEQVDVRRAAAATYHCEPQPTPGRSRRPSPRLVERVMRRGGGHFSSPPSPGASSSLTSSSSVYRRPTLQAALADIPFPRRVVSVSSSPDSLSGLEKAMWWLSRIPLTPVHLVLQMQSSSQAEKNHSSRFHPDRAGPSREMDDDGDGGGGHLSARTSTALKLKKKKKRPAGGSYQRRPSHVLSLPYPALGSLLISVELRKASSTGASTVITHLRLHQRLVRLAAFSAVRSALVSESLNDVLQGGTRLQFLYLDGCQCLPSASTSTAALRWCPQLKVFSAVGAADGGSGTSGSLSLQWMARSPLLEEVYLSRIPATIEGLSVLATLPQLRVLHVEGLAQVNQEQVLLWLGRCYTLEELNVRDCRGIDDLAALCGLRRLRVLLASELPCVYRVGEWVSGWRDLEVVDMEGCGALSDVAGLALAETLTSVNLSRTAVYTMAWVGGACRVSLETLLLADCMRVKSGLEAIALAPRLRRLDLRRCRLHSISWVSSCSALETLNMNGATLMRDRMAVGGVVGLLPQQSRHLISGVVLPSSSSSLSTGASPPPVLPPLSLGAGPGGAAADSSFLLSDVSPPPMEMPSLAFTQLTSLSLQDCHLTSVDFILGCRDLQSLDLSGCGGIDNFTAITHLGTSLRSLNLDLTNLRDLSWVSHCCALEEVHLKGCLSLVDFKELSLLSRCRFLDLSHTAIRSLDPFLHHPSLQSLLLHGCKALTSFAALATIPHLTTLDLARTKVSSIEWIAQCPSITHLALNDCKQLTANLRPLRSLPLLSVLNLKRLHVTDVSWLRHCRALKELYVAGSAASEGTQMCWPVFLPKQVEYVDVCEV